MKRKKWLAASLVLALMAGPGAASGAVEIAPAKLLSSNMVQSAYWQDPAPSTTSRVSLEKAIHNVKAHFQVPESYLDFQSGFQNQTDIKSWVLTWQSREETGRPLGQFHARVDAETGDILSVDAWSEERGPYPQRVVVPVWGFHQAMEKAENLTRQILGERFEQMRLITKRENAFTPQGPFGKGIYTFSWQRVHQGVSFPANTVSLTLSAEDGEVLNYNFNWSYEQMPPHESAIALEQAKQAFAAADLLELQYIDLLPKQPALEAKKQAKLVFRLSGKTLPMIDAYSGKPVQPKPGQYVDGRGEGYGGDLFGAVSARMEKASLKGAPALSPAEQKEVKAASKLINQDTALEVVRKWVGIGSEMVLSGAHIQGEDYGLADRIWNFNWENKSGQGYMSAQVNAVTGELLSFNLPFDTIVSPIPSTQLISEQEAQKMAEGFIKQLQPGRFEQVTLRDKQNYMGIPKPIMENPEQPNQPLLRYYFARNVNGIPFPNNGMEVVVDRMQKKVVQYRLNWQEIEFASTVNLLNKQQAVQRFLAKRPLELVYVRAVSSGQPAEVMLVYQSKEPVGQQPFEMIDAVTGLPLDWGGHPLPVIPPSGLFEDAANNYAEEAIQLLGQFNVLREYGSQFRPDENISEISLLKAMLALQRFGAGVDLEQEEVIRQARELGWLKADEKPAEFVDRITLAQRLVRWQGLEQAASLGGLYRQLFADEEALTAEMKGYAALAWGMGLVSLEEGGQFDPSWKVTRADAAYALVQALKIQ